MSFPTRITTFRTLTLSALALAWLGLATADAHPRRHDNPPGPRGGRGTNWANPPGPVGGPGATPYRVRRFRDCDNNPPGPRGGPGTSPNRRWRRR